MIKEICHLFFEMAPVPFNDLKKRSHVDTNINYTNVLFYCMYEETWDSQTVKAVKTVKSSRKYFVHLNWLATNPS